METMNLERLTVEELASIKGGRWIITDLGLIWREEYSLDPDSEN